MWFRFASFVLMCGVLVALGACSRPKPAGLVAVAPIAETMPAAVDEVRAETWTEPLTLANLPQFCQAEGFRDCRSVLAQLELTRLEMQPLLDRIEAEARRGCRTRDELDCQIAESIAFAGRRDTLMPNERRVLTESEAAVAHRCESGETTACAKAALAAMNAFDDYDAAGALRSGCLGGDVSQCWIAFVLTEDSHGLDPAGTLVAEACAHGESSACAAADWLKRPTTLLDAAARALPSDAVSSMSGLMLKAFPAGEPLRLNERVLVREINYGDGSLPPEVTTRRLRVGSMAGDQVRFAGRSGRVVTWHTIDGTLYVREQQVLGVLTHAWTSQIHPASPLVPRDVRADTL
jgi:hypothetical protein